MWTVVIEPPAQAEIAQAFALYEDKSYGLGGDSLRVIAAATERAYPFLPVCITAVVPRAGLEPKAS